MRAAEAERDPEALGGAHRDVRDGGVRIDAHGFLDHERAGLGLARRHEVQGKRQGVLSQKNDPARGGMAAEPGQGAQVGIDYALGNE